MKTQIRALTDSELNGVAGGENEQIGAQVVASMKNTIATVNQIISDYSLLSPAPQAPTPVPCGTNHNGVHWPQPA